VVIVSGLNSNSATVLSGVLPQRPMMVVKALSASGFTAAAWPLLLPKGHSKAPRTMTINSATIAAPASKGLGFEIFSRS
jgi:hypothetical protein